MAESLGDFVVSPKLASDSRGIARVGQYRHLLRGNPDDVDWGKAVLELSGILASFLDAGEEGKLRARVKADPDLCRREGLEVAIDIRNRLAHPYEIPGPPPSAGELRVSALTFFEACEAISHRTITDCLMVAVRQFDEEISQGIGTALSAGLGVIIGLLAWRAKVSSLTPEADPSCGTEPTLEHAFAAVASSLAQQEKTRASSTAETVRIWMQQNVGCHEDAAERFLTKLVASSGENEGSALLARNGSRDPGENSCARGKLTMVAREKALAIVTDETHNTFLVNLADCDESLRAYVEENNIVRDIEVLVDFDIGPSTKGGHKAALNARLVTIRRRQ